MATDEGNAIAGAIMAEAKAIVGAADHAPHTSEQTRSQLTQPSSPWAASMMRNIEQDVPRRKAERRLLPIAGPECPTREVGCQKPASSSNFCGGTEMYDDARSCGGFFSAGAAAA
jgi:hypothetical protein